MQNSLTVAESLRVTIFKNTTRFVSHAWVLLDEARWLDKHVRSGTYERNYRRRLNNSKHLPLVKQLLRLKKESEISNQSSDQTKVHIEILTSPAGSRYNDAHLKHQAAILNEFLPLCDDVALQRAATFGIHLRHDARERSAMHILPKKLLWCREA